MGPNAKCAFARRQLITLTGLLVRFALDPDWQRVCDQPKARDKNSVDERFRLSVSPAFRLACVFSNQLQHSTKIQGLGQNFDDVVTRFASQLICSRIATHDNDRHSSQLSMPWDLRQERHAVHHGHRQIEQDQSRALPARGDRFECIHAVFGRHYRISRMLQDLVQGFSCTAIVFNQEDRGTSPLPLLSSC